MPASGPIAFYISGHGFGHATRDIEIINALRARVPDLEVIVRTQASAWLFERSLTSPIEMRELECDTGVQQRDGLRVDDAASIRVAAEFHEALDAKAARETEFLRRRGIGLVLGDIPPLAFAAAAAANLPSLAIGNFTWDWIYEDFEEHVAKYPKLLPTIRDAYGHASLALRLPMHGGFAAFDGAVRDIPLVARRSRRTREEVRGALGLPDAPLVLLSFGGFGVQGLQADTLRRIARYKLVITDDASGRELWRDGESDDAGGSRRNVIQIADAQIRRVGCRYEDLVRAVDVVATKPGYGIVSESIANETAILYTDRGRFREYDVLVRGMQAYARSEFIPQSDLLAGDWEPYLDRLLSSPGPSERPRTDGAEVAAEIILTMAGRGEIADGRIVE